MAYFAELDANSVVLQVIVVRDADAPTEDAGKAFLASLFGASIWVQSGVAGRKNDAVIGATYDALRDAFIAPKPFPSWVLNETTCEWVPPA